MLANRIWALAAGLVLSFGVFSHCQAGEDALHLELYKGKVIYLDFWASWCEPCRESFPWLIETSHRLHDKGLVVVAVNLDEQDKLAQRFLHEFAPPFVVVFDPQGELAQKFEIAAMPYSIMIDRQGRVRYRHAGFFVAQRAQYQLELEGLLAEADRAAELH